MSTDYSDKLDKMRQAEIAYYEEESKKPFHEIPLRHSARKKLFDEVFWSYVLAELQASFKEGREQEMRKCREEIKSEFKSDDERIKELKQDKNQEIKVARRQPDPSEFIDLIESAPSIWNETNYNDRIESIKLYSLLKKSIEENVGNPTENFSLLFNSFLKDHPEYKGSNLLHFACAERWGSVVIYLVEEMKENINATNAQGLTPLLIALKKGHLEIAEYLLSKPKININYKIKGNVNSLHWCCAEGYDEVVKLLLEKGIDINAAVAPGYWPMFNNCRITPYTIALLNREFNIAELIINDERFKPGMKSDLLMALVTFFPDDEQQLLHVKKILKRHVNLKTILNLKEYKITKNVIQLAEYLQLDNVIPILENTGKR